MKQAIEQFQQQAANDPVAATQLIMQGFSELGRRNGRFANGELDYWKFETEENDRLNPLGNEEPLVGLTLRFDAQRFRSVKLTDGIITGLAKNSSLYTIVISSSLHNIELPDPIAEDQIGLPAQAAKAEIGAVSLCHQAQIGIYSDVPYVLACERYTYYNYDEDDEYTVYSDECACPVSHEDGTWYDDPTRPTILSQEQIDKYDLAALRQTGVDIAPEIILAPTMAPKVIIACDMNQIVSLWQNQTTSDSRDILIEIGNPVIKKLMLAYSALQTVKSAMDNLCEKP